VSTDAVVEWIVCAIIAGMISDRRNNGFVNGLVIGVLLNIFGVIIVMCHRPGHPRPPKGLVVVKCPRCNTVQDVPGNQPQFECWQCHLVKPVRTAVQS